MGYLTRDAILAAQDLPSADVEVPEWGGTVRVRALTGTERDAFEASIVDASAKGAKVNTRNMRAKLVAASVVDEQGNRIFSDTDIVALGRKSAAALNRVFEVAQRLSGLSETDVEELGKASETGQSGDSPSASPDTSAAPSENS